MTTIARRTQAERTAETQQALLDATIASLVEVGYARTTTRDIALRAGVSRGAQTHHYPTKNDLVVAAVERLFHTQTRRFADAFGALAPQRRTLDEALRLLWDIVNGPTFPAVLEVITASRTDADLRVVVHGVAARFEATVVELIGELFPGLDDPRVARTVIDVGFTLVQGAAVASYAGFGDPERTIRLARALAALATPESAPMLKGALDALDAHAH